jgi:hypothetical protein
MGGTIHNASKKIHAAHHLLGKATLIQQTSQYTYFSLIAAWLLLPRVHVLVCLCGLGECLEKLPKRQVPHKGANCVAHPGGACTDGPVVAVRCNQGAQSGVCSITPRCTCVCAWCLRWARCGRSPVALGDGWVALCFQQCPLLAAGAYTRTWQDYGLQVYGGPAGYFDTSIGGVHYAQCKWYTNTHYACVRGIQPNIIAAV